MIPGPSLLERVVLEKWCSPSQMSRMPILSANSAYLRALFRVSSPVIVSCQRMVSNIPNLMGAPVGVEL